MKISGYRPENSLTIPNPDFDPTLAVSTSNPDVIVNPAREIEDNYLTNSKTFFVQEGGDVSWLLKEIRAEDATKYLKYYVDSIFQISGIPNTSDAAFNSGDMNASAIDRKFYTMALMLDDVKQGVTTLIKHRWRNFLSRINLLSLPTTHSSSSAHSSSSTHSGSIFRRRRTNSRTYYDINDVTITIDTNLPSMTDETINQQLALNGILSQKTLLSNLGYDYATERKNKEEEVSLLLSQSQSSLSSASVVVAPDTAYVTPVSSKTTTAKTSTTSTSASQTNNQIAAKTYTPDPVPDRTDNIPHTQTREGRPTK